MRSRTTTIGSLSRTPARQESSSTPPTTPSEPPPEHGRLRRWLRGALFDNIGLKFLSMVLAVTVFLLVTSDKDREITLRLDVDYDYDRTSKVLVSEQLKEVTVTLKGPGRRLRELSERDLGILHLKTQNASGDLPITSDLITNLPAGIKVTSISPRSVRVTFDTLVDKVVEVQPSVIGRPEHGFRVKEATATPATTKVRGGQRVLAALTSIKTADVSVESTNKTKETLVALAPPDGVSVDNTLRVAVNLQIEEELVTRKLPSVPVTVADGADPKRWTITPAQVEVTLTGFLIQVDQVTELVEQKKLLPVVKVPPDAKGRADVKLGGLPAGVGVKLSPESVEVKPAKPSPVP